MIAQATELIRQRIGSVVALSGVYETEPWGVFDTPQQDFLNQALLVETPQNAHEVLHEALEIEAALGRVRKGDIHPSVANATAPLSQGSSIKMENVESAPMSQGSSNGMDKATTAISQGSSLSSTTLPLRQGEYPEGGRGWTMKYNSNRNELTSLRKNLRNHGTSAEAFLWTKIKGRQLSGYRFRRQFSIDKYILDFYCPQLHLAVELDGAVHQGTLGQPVEHDVERDKILKEKYGIHIVRFENRMVFENLKSVIWQIEDAIKECGGDVIPYHFDDTYPPLSRFATAPLSQGSNIKKENVESAPLPQGSSNGMDKATTAISQGSSLSSTTLPLRQGEYPEGGRGWNWQRGQCPPRIYSSRPMDIDLIFYNEEVIDTPELTIPHPRMHLRQFVLEPLAEIMPDYRHPVLGLTVKEMLDKLKENP